MSTDLLWDGPADIERWRMLAEEIRTYADNARDPGSRESLERIAQGYERLADRAEKRTETSSMASPSGRAKF